MSSVPVNNAAGSPNKRPSDDEVLAFGKQFDRWAESEGVPVRAVLEPQGVNSFSPDPTMNYDPTIYAKYSRDPVVPYVIDLQLSGWGMSSSGLDGVMAGLKAHFGLPSALKRTWTAFLNPPPAATPDPVAASIVGGRLPVSDDLSAAYGFKIELYEIRDGAKRVDAMAPGTRLIHEDGRIFEYFRFGFAGIGRAWRLVGTV